MGVIEVCRHHWGRRLLRPLPGPSGTTTGCSHRGLVWSYLLGAMYLLTAGSEVPIRPGLPSPIPQGLKLAIFGHFGGAGSGP